MYNLEHSNTLDPRTELEKFYNLILQMYPGGICITDAKANILYATDNMFELIGKKPEWLMGKNVQDLLDTGIIEDSITFDVISSNKKRARFLKSTDDKKFFAIGFPIYNHRDELTYVFCYVANKDEYYKANRYFQTECRNSQSAVQYLSEFNSKEERIIAESDAMKHLLTVTQRIAGTNSTVMIYGESGTGKEVVAHYIHQCSNRQSNPFIPVNCAAIPAELAESQFFGYEKGSFTGANKEGKAGLFEFANTGTLFLDEIGELPLTIQSKLLRVLETGKVSRVGGGEKEKTVDVRIIAATNRNLFEEVQKGTFREDLYYRLNVFPVTLAPLRERPEDVEALAEWFLDKYNKTYHTHKFFDPITMTLFKRYKWPGNVRELRNIVERLALLSEDTITPDLLDASFTQHEKIQTQGPKHSRDFFVEGKSLKTQMKEFEAFCIKDALSHYENDVPKAAQSLDMPVSTLYQKMRTYGLNKKG